MAADKRHLKAMASITDIFTEVTGRRLSRKLAQALGRSAKIIQATLHKDLKLSKRSARWVPKLPDEEVKKKRVRTREVYHSDNRHGSLTILDNFLTVGELRPPRRGGGGNLTPADFAKALQWWY